MTRHNVIINTYKARNGSVRKRKLKKYGGKAAGFAKDMLKALWIGIIFCTILFILPSIFFLLEGFIMIVITSAILFLEFLKFH
jgi:hypothetical protein